MTPCTELSQSTKSDNEARPPFSISGVWDNPIHRVIEPGTPHSQVNTLVKTKKVLEDGPPPPPLRGGAFLSRSQAHDMSCGGVWDFHTVALALLYRRQPEKDSAFESASTPNSSVQCLHFDTLSDHRSGAERRCPRPVSWIYILILSSLAFLLYSNFY